ncbi:histidine kinase [Actinomadura kijaniata]
MRPRIPRLTAIAAIIVAMALVTLAGLVLSPMWDELVTRRDAGRIAVAVPLVAAVFALYGRLLWLNLVRRAAPVHRSVQRLGLAAVLACCWTLPALLGVGQGWANALVVPAGLIAVVLPARQAAAVTGAVAALTFGYGLVLDLPVLTLLYNLAGIPLTAFSGYVTIWLVHVVQELHEARAELAGAAVGEERLRFARDLHDVLGHSLQAVALRAEVAERFLDRDPGRVRGELVEIQAMARDSVRDVREVVRGYRATSLRGELDGVSAVLRAAGIVCDRPDLPPDLPARVHEPLGWVAREAATNVLRHAGASWCRITVDADGPHVRLEIVNDGAGRRAGTGGSGLTGLAERLRAAGGALAAGPAGDGTFRVTATVPKGDT